MVENICNLKIGKARAILAWIWFIGVLVLVVLLVCQIANQFYVDWKIPCGWLSSLAFPTLTMIIAVSSAGQVSAHDHDVHSKNFFYLAVAVSIIYILCLYLIVFIAIFINHTSSVENTMSETLWVMGVFQAIVSSILAKFFVEEMK